MATYKPPTTRLELLTAVKQHLQLLADGQSTEAAKLLSEWEEFYAMYAPLLQRFCKRLRFDEKDTDNLLQQVWLKVRRALLEDQYRREKGRFHRWLATVVKNAGIDEAKLIARQRQRTEAVSAETFTNLANEKGESPAQVFDIEQERAEVHAVLDRMRRNGKERSAELLERIYFQQQEIGEIAEDLKMMKNAVSSALVRAKHAFHVTYRQMFGSDLLDAI